VRRASCSGMPPGRLRTSGFEPRTFQLRVGQHPHHKTTRHLPSPPLPSSALTSSPLISPDHISLLTSALISDAATRFLPVNLRAASERSSRPALLISGRQALFCRLHSAGEPQTISPPPRHLHRVRPHNRRGTGRTEQSSRASRVDCCGARADTTSEPRRASQHPHAGV